MFAFRQIEAHTMGSGRGCGEPEHSVKGLKPAENEPKNIRMRQKNRFMPPNSPECVVGTKTYIDSNANGTGDQSSKCAE